MTGEEKHFSDEYSVSLVAAKNEVVAIGQTKLSIYYLPQTGKCPHLYHCEENLSMTIWILKLQTVLTMCIVGHIRAKCYCVLFECSCCIFCIILKNDNSEFFQANQSFYLRNHSPSLPGFLPKPTESIKILAIP